MYKDKKGERGLWREDTMRGDSGREGRRGGVDEGSDGEKGKD